MHTEGSTNLIDGWKIIGYIEMLKELEKLWIVCYNFLILHGHLELYWDVGP